MQRLKVILATLFIFALLLMFGMPVVMMRRPAITAPLRQRELFSLMITGYFLVIILVLAAVMLLSWRLWRLQQEDLAEQRIENLKDLVEGTLNDHGRNQDS